MATGSGSLQAQNSTLVGVSERQVNVTAGIETTFFGPATSAFVSYDGTDIIITGYTETRNGRYSLTPYTFKVTGTYTWATDSNYRVWEKIDGDNDIEYLAWSTVFENWMVFEETVSISTVSHGDSLADNSPSGVSASIIVVTTTSDSPSEVTGLGERTGNVTGTPQAQSSATTGLAEREVPSPNVGLLNSLSSVSGSAARHQDATGVLNDDDANVVGGFAEREVFQLLPPGSGDFKPTEYHLVTGVGEVKKVATGINMPDDDSTVTGFASRHQDATGALEFTDNDSIVVGKGGIGYEATGALQAQASTVVGVSERTINGSGDLVDGASTVSGVAERIVVEVEADLTADEVGVVAVTGDSERIIVGSSTMQAQSSAVVGATVIKSNGTGTLQPSDDSSVVGVSEREIVASGTLVVDDESTVSGVAERQIDGTGSGNSQSGPSTVTGTAENTITGSGALVVQATLFPATGFAERSITGSGAASQTSNSVVAGVGENEVTSEAGAPHADLSSVSGVGAVGRHASGTLVDGVSSVVGISERVIVEVEADLTADEVGVSIVAGIAENIIPGSGTLQTGSSTLSGVSERTINGNGVLTQTSDSTVSGAAERVVTVDAGIDMPDDASVVVGVSERTINGTGATQQTSDSVVVAVSERINTAEGSLTTGESVVVGATEITHNRLPDINGYPGDAGDTAFGPDSTDSKVDYVSRPQSYAPRYLKLNGTSNVNRDGTYDVLISGFTVAENGLNYTTTATTTYNVYYKERGSAYDVVVYNTTRSAWYISTIANIDSFFVGSIPNATVSQENLVSTNSIVPYGIEFDPLDAEPSEVVGLSERIIVGSGALEQSVHSRVVGVAERETVAGTGAAIDTLSTVVGLALIGRVTSPELNTVSDSLVDGLSERIVTVDAGIEQVDASVVAGVAERTIGGEGTLVQSTDSVVAGVAERVITVDAGIDMPDDDSKVAGVAERIVTVDAGIEQVDVSVVAGLAERIVVLESGIDMPDDDSKIVGVSERVITGTGDLVPTTNNLVNGVAEVIKVATGINMPDDDSKVNGLAERIIGKFILFNPQAPDNLVNGLAERIVENNNITLQIISQESTIVGLGERTINLLDGIFSADSDQEQSRVTGIVERQIDAFGILQDSDSTVFGEAERIIENNEITQALKPTDNNIVAGVAERIVVLQEGIDMPDDDSKIVGVAERTVVDVDATPKAQESRIVGVAERTINLFSGIDMPDDDSKVVGVAEREVENNAISQDLKPTDNNLVTGVAERIINLFESPQAQDAHMGQDEVITIDRHPIGGTEYPEYRSDLQAGDADPEMDGDRVITQETDGESTKLKFGPNSSDPNVVYINPKYLRLAGNADPLNDGVYDLLGTGFTCSVSGGTNLTLTENKNYNVYYRKVGYQDYRVCMFRTTNLTWVAFQTTLNPELFFTTGAVITNGQLNGELIASTSQSRGGPYKIMRPTLYNLVVGDADRVSDINDVTPVLKPTDNNIVEGVASRMVKPFDGAIHADPSRIVGIAERTLNNDGLGQQVASGPSTVAGDAERVITGAGILVSGQSSLGGLAENQIDLEQGIAQVDDAVVSGIGVRASNVLEGIEPIDNLVNGVAERTVVGSGTPQGDESTVNGSGPRTSNGFGVLECSVSQVLATDDRVSVGVPGKVNPKAGPSTVTATVDRTVHGVDATVASDPSIVDGSGFRTSKGSGELLDDHDHLVDGVAERVITASGNLETEDSTVVGEAFKIVQVVQGIAQVSSSRVEGVAERSITIEAELQAGDSRVEALVYTNNIEQQAMHVQRAFRIRKAHTRRIIVRQTPTNRL